MFGLLSLMTGILMIFAVFHAAESPPAPSLALVPVHGRFCGTDALLGLGWFSCPWTFLPASFYFPFPQHQCFPTDPLYT